MFRAPPLLLSDTILVAETILTGLGEQVAESGPIRARVTTNTKWSADTAGATIQTVTNIVTNAPISIGATIVLPSGETVEAKQCEPVRYFARTVCFETKAW